MVLRDGDVGLELNVWFGGPDIAVFCVGLELLLSDVIFSFQGSRVEFEGFFLCFWKGNVIPGIFDVLRHSVMGFRVVRIPQRF